MPFNYPNYGPQLPESYYADQSLGRMDPSRSSEFPTLQEPNQAPFQISGFNPTGRDLNPPEQGPFGADLPRDLQSMIAPYRDMASKFSSPYLMMNQNNWLARTHPGIAGRLDNALASVALSKYPSGPATGGQNLSAALGGVLEANQMRREHAMQNAMLPYHMLQPQLAAEKEIAQTQNYLSEIPYRHAMEQRAEAQAEAQQRYFMPHPTGQTQQDTQGNRWQEIYNPIAQTSRWKNPSTNKFSDELPEEQQPKFAPQHQAGGGTEMERIWAQQDAQRTIAGLPPLTPEEKKADLIRQAGGRAGATAAGTEAIKTPIEDQEKFRDYVLKQHEEMDPKIPSYPEFLKEQELSFNYKLFKPHSTEIDEDKARTRFQELYGKDIDLKQQRIDQRTQYRQGTAWKQGIGMEQSQTPTAKAKPTTREYKYDAQGNRIP